MTYAQLSAIADVLRVNFELTFTMPNGEKITVMNSDVLSWKTGIESPYFILAISNIKLPWVMSESPND